VVQVGDGHRRPCLAARSEELIELALALSDHTGRNSEMLLRHAFGDPDPDIRFRRTCFEVLLRDYARSEPARDALAAAGKDPDPVLGFLAARHLGESGRPILRQLLRDGGLPEELRVEAVGLLGPLELGGLALAPEAASEGGLSMEQGAAPGALSVAEEPEREA